MPFGKKSQVPVPKAFMAKKHAGFGNHKVKRSTNAAVRSATSLKAAPTNQPASRNGSAKTSGK